MFEGISGTSWAIAAIIAAAGAAACALLPGRLRLRALAVWIAAPLALCMATSSFSGMRDAAGLIVLYLLIPTLPWSVVSATAYVATRAICRASRRQEL